jgi:hypothetical protein
MYASRSVISTTPNRKPIFFAVPTYTVDGKIVFLGNPTDQQIHELLGKAQFEEIKMTKTSEM